VLLIDDLASPGNQSVSVRLSIYSDGGGGNPASRLCVT
jgi:hypothetical protein